MWAGRAPAILASFWWTLRWQYHYLQFSFSAEIFGGRLIVVKNASNLKY